MLATRLGGAFGFPPTGISTFWPPNAILFASILMLEKKHRIICLLLAFPTYVVAELWIGFELAASLVFAAVNCLAVGLAIGVVRRFRLSSAGLSNLRQLGVVLVAVISASVLGGGLGATWVAYSGGSFQSTALRWALADFVGYLVFVPVIIDFGDYRDWWRTSTLSNKLEAAAAAGSVVALSMLSYGPKHIWGDEFAGAQFLPIPVMLWMALRFGPKGAATSSLAVSTIALLYAINGFGPFADLSPEKNVASLQFFITSIVVATLLVAALIRERDDALKQLSEIDQHQKEERYRALVDLAIDAILITDVEADKFIEANPLAAQILGYSTETLLNSIAPEALSPEFQPDARRSVETMRAYLNEALQGGFPSFEWTFRNRDRQDIPCEVSLAAFPDSRRQLVRSSIVDITERIAEAQHRSDLETQLAQAQKLEAIGQMTGGVAHDFNNLLNVILGNLELLLEETENPEDNDLINAAIDATYKGAGLTKSMLNFARRAHLEPTQLNLSEIVRDMDNWISRTIPASIKVAKSLQPDLWQTVADLSNTESALLNLMINARDAMPNGGVITIETSNVTIDALLNGDIGDELAPGRYALLAVSDTGDGISPENIERVFDPFFTTKEPGEGTGLGLSMVHGFMNQSHGSVRIYSEIGIGTTVKLYFKTSDVPEIEQPIDKSEPDVAPKTTARILIAEDQEAVIDLLVRILRNEGHEVAPALTGDQALQIFQSDNSFDLLVTDIVMPGQLQGPELARQLRRLNPALPVVFMSGYAWEATTHGIGLRQSDIRLMKPVSKKDLVNSVQSALASLRREKGEPRQKPEC